MNTNNDNAPFVKVIYSYTRKQAIADGFQVDVSTVAKEAGIRFPVFLRAQCLMLTYPSRRM